MSQSSSESTAVPPARQPILKPDFWRIQGIRSSERNAAEEWLKQQVKELGLPPHQGFSLAADSDRTLCATLTSYHTPAPSQLYWHVNKDFIGFTPLSDPENAIVDVVAITGLGGHALGSFRSKNGASAWLRDFAPEDMPHARFITYGYITAVIGSDSKQGVYGLARDLLDGLAIFRSRTQTRDRPICFVCHSLGGVVLKEALVISSKATDQRHYDQREIVLATCGLILLGVPNLGLRHEQLMAVVEGQPNAGFINDLLVKTDGEASQFLSSLTRDFMQLCREQPEPWTIISYYELLQSPTIMELNDGNFKASGKKVFMVTQHSATFASNQVGEIDHHASPANHRDLVRFEHPFDTRYLSLIDKLKKMAPDAPAATSSLVPTSRASRETSGSPSIPGRGLPFPAPARSEGNFRWLSSPEPLLGREGVSECAPALATFGADLVAMWRGKTSHEHLYWARIIRGKNNTLSRSKIMIVHPNALSQGKPSLAALSGTLVAIWKGVSQSILYFSTLRLGTFEWSDPVGIARCSGDPTLASSHVNGLDRVYAVWRGVDGDQTAYLSWYDGDWTIPFDIPFVSTETDVGLVCHEGKIVISWKDSDTESTIRWMHLNEDGQALDWPQVPDSNCKSKFAPALAVLRGTVYAAWKPGGVNLPLRGADLCVKSWSMARFESRFTIARLPYMTFDNSADLAPTLVTWGDWLVLSWRSADSGKSMRWTYGKLD